VAIKSYRPGQDDEERPSQLHPTRGTKLTDLERRVKLRKKTRKSTGPTAAQRIGKGIMAINRAVERSAARMPSGNQINRDLWG